MVGLHCLKHTFNESDESVVDRFFENPYWQYFCGFEYFQHNFPVHFTMMNKFRGRIGPDGIEKMLQALIHSALKTGAIKTKQLRRVVVDTTVQEKAITFPTDSKLYYKMREILVLDAKEREIKLRQVIHDLGKKPLFVKDVMPMPSNTKGREERLANSKPTWDASCGTSGGKRPILMRNSGTI